MARSDVRCSTGWWGGPSSPPPTAAGGPLGIRRENREVAIPARRQVSPLHLIDLARKPGVRGPVRRKERCPLTAGCGAACADSGGEVLADAVGDQEPCFLRPAVAALGEADLLVTERLAVGRCGVMLVRGAGADVAVGDDQGGGRLRLPEGAESLLHAIHVGGVTHPQGGPPRRGEPGGDVLRVG